MRVSGIAVALTLAVLADVAPAQKADVPQIKVGDRWKFGALLQRPVDGAESRRPVFVAIFGCE